MAVEQDKSRCNQKIDFHQRCSIQDDYPRKTNAILNHVRPFFLYLYCFSFCYISIASYSDGMKHMIYMHLSSYCVT